MPRYNWELEQRENVARRYDSAFASLISQDFAITTVEEHNHSAWAQYTISVSNRADFQKKLQAAGVPTSIHYPRIMPDQPYYQKTADPSVDLSKSRWAADHVISIPMYPDMTEQTQEMIIAAVKEAL
jgi:UDP-2-acetamido-2-deoxy-ribo-hexuluronate aminotransferase